LVNSAIAVLLPVMLIRAGYDEGQSLSLFGIVSGMVLPILFIPSTLIGSISMVLVPELSEDFYRKNYARLYKNIRRGLHAAVLIACAIIPFFYAFGKDLGHLAFASPLAGEMIQKSCILLLPMSVSMIATGILNSLGFEKKTFVFYFIGAGALFLCITLLPPLCGVYAYVFGMIVSFSLNALLCLLLLQKKCRIFQKRWGQIRGERYFKALLCVLPLSLIGQLFLLISKQYFGEFWSVCVAALCLAVLTCILYLFLEIFPNFPLKKQK
jgi:stage V sporulation protein B